MKTLQSNLTTQLITLLVISLFISIASITEVNGQECGTEVTQAHRDYMERTRELRNAVDLNLFRANTVLPITAHIIRTSGGSGGLSVSSLNTGMAELNEIFEQVDFEFEVCNINYINNSSYYDGIIPSTLPTSEEYSMAISNRVDGTINIFFMPNLDGLCGYTNFPGSVRNWIVMRNDCTVGGVLAHEVGHYFNLHHTFNGSNELADGSNCGQGVGDGLCDTPADPVNSSTLRNICVSSNCVYICNYTDQNGDVYSPDMTNVMSYSRFECLANFSPQQIQRMQQSYIIDRAPELGTCNNPNPQQCELIENGTFNNGSSNWEFYKNAQATAYLTTTGNKANINITNGGTERWHVQLYQEGIPITSGKRYLISFKAKADEGRNISIDVSDGANHANVYYNQTVWVGKQLNRKYFIYEPGITNSSTTLIFNLGKNNHNVEIDEVVFKELSCSNLNNLITNGHFDNGESNWIEFENAAASAYGSAFSGYHKYAIYNGGTSKWHVRLKQGGIALSTGSYTLSFRAKTDINRSIEIKLNASSENQYSGSKNIKTDWKTFNVHFNVDQATTDGRLFFLLGKNANDVFLDDVILVKETGLSPRLSNESASITKEINDSFEVKSVLDMKEDSVKAYPNPFNDKLTIELQSLNISNGTVGLYSISGSLIQEQAFENEAMLELNTGDLFPGMYLIQVSTNDKVYTKKLLKQ